MRFGWIINVSGTIATLTPSLLHCFLDAYLAPEAWYHVNSKVSKCCQNFHPAICLDTTPNTRAKNKKNLKGIIANDVDLMPLSLYLWQQSCPLPQKKPNTQNMGFLVLWVRCTHKGLRIEVNQKSQSCKRADNKTLQHQIKFIACIGKNINPRWLKHNHAHLWFLYQAPTRFSPGWFTSE